MKLFFVIFTVLIFCSCSNKYDYIIKNNIAEGRYFLLGGESEGLKAEVICGIRESGYKTDGVATEPKDFCVLTFFVEEDYVYAGNETYKLAVGDKSYSGVLKRNPFDNSLVADIGKIINNADRVIASLIIDSKKINIEMKDKTRDFNLKYEDVVKLVAKDYKKEIKLLTKNNSISTETYIKIIDDYEINKSEYFWYVKMINSDGKSLNMIISPYTAQVLAINKNIDEKNG